ncbi:MAG: hypothetical protein AAGJ40_09490 [Planctomycetota bacterium]
MRVIIAIVAVMATAQTGFSQYPDGTLVLSSKRGIVGRVAKSITGGDQYTHIGIVIDGRVHDMDYPRPHSTSIRSYGKRGSTNDYYVPTTPYTAAQVAAMRLSVQSRTGQRYGLRAYLGRSRASSLFTWCSPYVGKTLNASGRYRLSTNQYHEPQNVIASVGGGYRFSGRTVK